MVTPAEGEAMMSPFSRRRRSTARRCTSEDDIARSSPVRRRRRAVRAAGFDGIELHAGHGYLLDEFLSPAMNTPHRRLGRWLEGRARLLPGVPPCAIRARLGDECRCGSASTPSSTTSRAARRSRSSSRSSTCAVDEGIDAVHVSRLRETDVGDGTRPMPTSRTRRATRCSDTSAPSSARRRAGDRVRPSRSPRGRGGARQRRRRLRRDGSRTARRPRPAAQAGDGRALTTSVRASTNTAASATSSSTSRCAAWSTRRRPRVTRTVRRQPRPPRHVSVIGAGAAGMEAARLLVESGHRGHAGRRRDRARWSPGAGRRGRSADGGAARVVAPAGRSGGVELRLGWRLDMTNVAAVGADEVVDATGTSWPGLDEFTASWPVEDRNQPLAICRRRQAGPVDRGRCPPRRRGRHRGGAERRVRPACRHPRAGPLRGRRRSQRRGTGDGATDGVDLFDLRPAVPVTVGHLGAHLVGDVTGTWGIEPAFQQARALVALARPFRAWTYGRQRPSGVSRSMLIALPRTIL